MNTSLLYKKLLRASFSLFMLLALAHVSLFPIVARAQSTGESISRFDVRVSVEPDGSLRVVEDILYNFGTAERRGIFREIPRSYQVQSETGTERYSLLIENIEVSSPSAPSILQEENTRSVYRFRIGDPNVTISGEHLYTVSYTALNAISFFNDFDEVYWNATGSEWNVPIQEATLTIELHETVDPSLVRRACYAGREGAQESCETASLLGEVQGVRFTARELSPGEGLTGAFGFPKGLVPETEREVAGPSRMLISFLTTLLCILLAFTYIHVIHSRKRNQEPKGRSTVVREYDAPPTLSPGEVGYIVDKQINNHDITAEIVYLAEQGYLHILSVPKKAVFATRSQFYLLELNQSDDTLRAYQKQILTSLFSSTYTMSSREKDTLVEEITKSTVIRADKALLLAKIQSAQNITPLKDLKDSFHVDLQSIRAHLLSSMFERGYLVRVPTLPLVQYVISTIAIAGLSIILAILVASLINPLILVGYFISVLLFTIWGATAFPLYKRTEEGVRAKEHSLGLREYLSIAEKDRLEFHFNPKKNPELFEKLLPFAIALKVDTLWARELEDVFIRPDWYTDARTAEMSIPHFNQSFAGFNTAVASAYTPPSSSGGSSGGGFSGGGAGGGGGGSW